MKTRTRWIASIAAGAAAVPAGYAAGLLLCSTTSIGSFIALAGALALIP
jgi:hypothetical protein